MTTLNQTPKPRQPRKPKTAKADNTVVENVSINVIKGATASPAPVGDKKKSQHTHGLYGAVQVVTSNRLLRSFVNNGYKASFFIPDENYTALTILGLEMGCTWDEVLRGLIEMHLASSDKISGLKNFVPALQ
jgi:hypothetical protein